MVTPAVDRTMNNMSETKPAHLQGCQPSLGIKIIQYHDRTGEKKFKQNNISFLHEREYTEIKLYSIMIELVKKCQTK